VVGLDDIATATVGGDTVIIDGFRGVVIIDPDDRTLEEYRHREADTRKVARRLRRQTRLPSESIDGHQVQILANIELPQEVHSSVELGADGIGLFRTEFLYFQSPRNGEELHFQNYRMVMQELGGRPLTIRTLDIGGDKALENSSLVEDNPFLGCRSIRWCLNRPDVFREQLRAILRASALGPVRLMYPMITSIHELDSATVLLDEVRDDLRQEGVPFDEEMPVGVMVEVPSLALIADLLASRVDFLSVGTNDLVQYTLAVDRGNEHVADLYDPVHPAVLRLLVQILDVGRRWDIEVSVCGEMAAEPLYIPLLLGLGLRKISVSPQLIPETKRVIRSLRAYETQEIAARCLEMSDGVSITRALKRWALEKLPELGERI